MASKSLCACLLAIVLGACSNLSPAAPSATQIGAQSRILPEFHGYAAAPAGDVSGACAERPNDTAAKLVQCVGEASLWAHLSQFQRIANENPGLDGHGSRDTGTRGYEASVDYVATLMRRAGYNVTIQPYIYMASEVIGTPEFRIANQSYTMERDWFVARHSGSGSLTAAVVPPSEPGAGCSPKDFADFVRGSIALLERSTCAFDTQVANASAAGAAAAILYTPEGSAYEARLTDPASIPVVGVAAYAVGAELLRRYLSRAAPTAQIDICTRRKTGVDYNVIADSPFGDPGRIVTIDAHLDSIYGAGMLDNASGSTTILDIALNMAKTRTLNRLRYIWFGGEELGLLGSNYYTKHLTSAELHRSVFDVDVDVTASPNFDIMVADPAFAWNVARFPANVVPQSKVGNAYLADFFKTAGVASRPAGFGNGGTDSNSFSLIGVPNTGILTQQDCCKNTWETKLWGGFRGNYEGDIPSFNGGCVDVSHRWCDNLSNNDPFVLDLISKSVAYVTFELANNASLKQ